MVHRRRRPSRIAFAATALSLALVAQGATKSSIPLAPHGDGTSGPVSQPVPLTPSCFLVGAEGADGTDTTADDVTLLCMDVGTATPTVTPLATPFQSRYSTYPARLSATRVLLIGAGPNGRWSDNESDGDEDDEVVHVLDRIGSANTVTSIPVANLMDDGPSEVKALSANSAIVRTTGPDRTRNTADDTIALLTDIGGTNMVTEFSVPFTRDANCRPTVLTPTSFLAGSRGPDGNPQSADDVVYLFTDVGGTNTRTEISTPFRTRNAPGQCVRVSDSRAVVCSVGPDANDITTDDQLLLLDGLDGTSPTVTPIGVGAIEWIGAGRPTVLTPDVIVLAGAGADQLKETADDVLIVVSGLGSTNTVTEIPIGFITEGAAARPTRLSDTACAFVTVGPDGISESEAPPGGGADDQLAIVTDIGGTNTVTRIDIPGLDEGSASEITPLSADAFVFCSGGPDGDVGAGNDDVVNVVTNVTGTPAVETIDLDGEIQAYNRSFQPQALGHGRAAFMTTGPDGSSEAGGDDLVQILTGLPGSDVRGLTASKIDIKFRASKPQKPTRVSAKARLYLDGVPFRGPITISIGNAAQTIPESALTRSKKGVVTYKDRKRVNGFVSKFSYNPKNGKVSVAGKGLGTAAETTSVDHVPLGIQTADIYLSDSGAGVLKKSGIRYRAPK